MTNIGQFALPCKASSLRGKLKHSYLENAVCLPALPKDLTKSLTYKENGVARQQIIRQQIREFTDLMASSEQGFSPAQLVGQLRPFQVLVAEDRRSLKEQIHRQFVQEFQLAERKARFESAAAIFLSALDVFLEAPPGDDKSAQSSMLKLQGSARGLIRELEEMPKGIWLWKTVKIGRMSS